MIKLVDLPEDFLDRYPSQLSGGQQQRIGVVRALAADQDIILMDEPFGALDPITREDLQDLVKDLQERLGKTFIFVTHDMDEALRLSSRIVVMTGGKQVQVDTPENILRKPANDFVANLIGQDRLIQAKPSITTVGQVANKPVSIAIDQPVVRALDIMHSRRVDTLLVTDAEQHLKGVVSIEKINEYYHSGKTVGEIMDPNVFYVNENSIIRDTVDRILKRGLRNVPVVDNDRKLVGIVTRATLVDIVYDALFTDDGITTDSSTDASSKSEEQKEKDGDQ
jgi:osmoprotectant transport system ATP-binding protein